MPVHKSVLKRERENEARRLANRINKSIVHTAKIRLEEAIAAKERVIEPRRYPSEDAIAEISATLLGLHKGQIITVVYYGIYEQVYLQLTGPVTKVDSYWQNLQVGNTTIEFPEIDQLFTDIPITAYTNA